MLIKILIAAPFVMALIAFIIAKLLNCSTKFETWWNTEICQQISEDDDRF